MRIGSLNLNGIRSASQKGLLEYLSQKAFDFMLFQETRTPLEYQFPSVSKMHWVSAPCSRPGYSGVAVLMHEKWSDSIQKIQYPILDSPVSEEGRSLLIEFPKFILINLYIPSGSSSPERQALKLEYLQALIQFHKTQNFDKPLIIGGDLNLTPSHQDLFHWKSNEGKPGCTIEERSLFAQWCDTGELIDSYRWIRVQKNIESSEEYTWWTSRMKSAFIQNRGWRIDMILTSQSLTSAYLGYEISRKPRFSDHAIYWLDIADFVADCSQ